MTPARTRTYGFETPSSRQLLLEAMLCAFIAMVFSAVSTLGMIFNRLARDWHANDAHEVLPQETSSNHIKENSQAEPTGLTSGNGPSAVFPAKAGIQSARNARSQHTGRCQAHSLSSRKPHRGYPGPIVQSAWLDKWFPALRASRSGRDNNHALRPNGLT